MILYVHEMIHRCRITDLQFFATAYWWRWGKQYDVSGDVLAFRTQGYVPRYVIDYCDHLDRETQSI